MMKIELNNRPASKISNMLFGVIGIIDGLIRILSFGVLRTDFIISFASRQAKSRAVRVGK